MAEYKIFVASSMVHKFRNDLCDWINGDGSNEVEKLTGYKLKLVAFSNVYDSDDGHGNTQENLNKEANTSDLFILLAENGKTVGDKTIEEYNSVKSNPKVAIRAFGLLHNEDAKDEKDKKDNAIIEIKYRENGKERNLEELLGDDHYLECKYESDFLQYVQNGIKYCVGHSLNVYQQEYLDYGAHINAIGQGGIRQNNERYCRREGLDGAVEAILDRSPIVILEGTTYSGKTRAAFELMKSNANWKDARFHIYNNCYDISDLNYIRIASNPVGQTEETNAPKDIYFFDDINDIIWETDQKLRRTENTLWCKLNGYNQGKGFSLEDFGNSRIIITVSGRLSKKERIALYEYIFNTKGTEFEKKLDDIIVDFDIYDQKKFQEMVDEMVRNGVIPKSKAVAGNYTIGSLFIKEDEVFKRVYKQYQKNPALVTTLAGHFKCTSRSRFLGNKKEINELYGYIRNWFEDRFFDDDMPATINSDVEALRREGILFISGDKSVIQIDKYVVDIISELINETLTVGEKSGSMVLNSILIGYAKECQNNRVGQADALSQNNICYVTQMGYRLVHYNRLDDKELEDLIILVAKSEITSKPRSNRGEQRYAEMLIEISKLQGQKEYPTTFVTTVIARFNNFAEAEKKLKLVEEYAGVEAKALYKQLVYAMLSTSNRTLTMAQERGVIGRIFENTTSEQLWKAPFAKKDMRNPFNLARIIPYLSKYSAKEIVEDLVPEVDIIQDTSEEEKWNFDNLKVDISEEESDSEYNHYATQLGKAIITVLYRVDSFEEFVETLNAIKKLCDVRPDISKVVKRLAFGRSFYKKAVLQIVNRLRYDDRAKLFDFVFKSFDSQSTTPDLVEELCLNISELREDGIRALNNLLRYLDEGAALDGYNRMRENDFCDSYTLSMLMNNDFLTFEQLYNLFETDDPQNHYLTQNQLMDKAQTLSDAEMCMQKILGVSDGDPSKLRDENALVGYLKIEAVRANKCIEIIKKRRSRFKERLSDSALTVLLKKFSPEQLVDIFCLDTNRAKGYYEEEYGLLDDEEVKGMRKNAVHINLFISKAGCIKEYRDKVKDFFEKKIIGSDNGDNLRHLIKEPEYNDSILSAYMKGGVIYDNYDDVRGFYDDEEDKLKCKPEKPGEHIYSALLWHVNSDFEKGEKDRSASIALMNKVLNEAYNDFAKNYTREEVVKKMAKLYKYVPLLLENDNFDEERELGFAYEGENLKMTFKKYVEHLKANNPSYANGTFIYNTLLKMNQCVDKDIYKTLQDIASANRDGVRYDSVNKLADVVRQRLLYFNKEKSKLDEKWIIDEKLLYNVSHMKLLCHMLGKKIITFTDAEKYRKHKKLPITQTYFNVLVKKRAEDVQEEADKAFNQNKDKKEAEDVKRKKYSKLTKYVTETLDHEDNKHLSRSIETCIALIGIAPNKISLNKIFTEKGLGFCDFVDRTEVMSARMNRVLKLIYDNNKKGSRKAREDYNKALGQFKKMIIANCANVNIYVVNVYLRAFLESVVFDQETMSDLYKGITKTDKVNMFTLLELNKEKDKKTIREKLGLEKDKDWLIEANVQTYTYFASCDKKLIETMDTKFGGDFTYDENGKKSCLEDAIKNYIKQHPSLTEQNGIIVKKLLLPENEQAFWNLCKQYILRSSYYWQGETKYWNEMPKLWQEALDNAKFCEAVAGQILYLNNNQKLGLNPSDAERIEILQDKLSAIQQNDTEHIKILKDELSAIQQNDTEHIKILKDTLSAIQQNAANAQEALDILKKLQNTSLPTA